MFVRGLMADWGIDSGTADDAELLVTELVTNAVIHARTPVTVEVAVGRDSIYFEVSDRSCRQVQLQTPSPESASGRGLMLLDRIAPGWEVVESGAGKTVRFSLETHPAPGMAR